LQVELLDRKRWRTRVELANAIFKYLELFHSRQRRHSALGMMTPVECEITDPAGHPVIVMRQGEPEDRSDRVPARNQTKEEGY
jgi:hypothetical protein